MYSRACALKYRRYASALPTSEKNHFGDVFKEKKKKRVFNADMVKIAHFVEMGVFLRAGVYLWPIGLTVTIRY